MIAFNLALAKEGGWGEGGGGGVLSLSGRAKLRALSPGEKKKKKKTSCGGVGKLITAAALRRRRSSRAPRVTRDDLGTARRRRKSETITDAPIFLLESFSMRPFLQGEYEHGRFSTQGSATFFQPASYSESSAIAITNSVICDY